MGTPLVSGGGQSNCITCKGVETIAAPTGPASVTAGFDPGSHSCLRLSGQLPFLTMFASTRHRSSLKTSWSGVPVPGRSKGPAARPPHHDPRERRKRSILIGSRRESGNQRTPTLPTCRDGCTLFLWKGCRRAAGSGHAPADRRHIPDFAVMVSEGAASCSAGSADPARNSSGQSSCRGVQQKEVRRWRSQ